MKKSSLSVLAAIAACGLATAAHAGTGSVTAHFSQTFDQTVNVTQVGVHDGDLLTVTFNWARVDAPGVGVDETLPTHFIAYCVEINQHVGGGTDYLYECQSAADHGFSALQEKLLGRLWYEYQGAVHDATTSAAFQMAVWELAFDTGANLSSGNFTGNNPAPIVALSQSWLDAITDLEYTGGQSPIKVLHSPDAQDQLVPTPGALALLGLGGLAAGRRRR